MSIKKAGQNPTSHLMMLQKYCGQPLCSYYHIINTVSIQKTLREEVPAALCLRCQTNDLFTGSESPEHLSVDYVGIALNSRSSTREKGDYVCSQLGCYI